jgi:hypothetical protein
MTQICEAEIALEICPTSNLLMKALKGEEALARDLPRLLWAQANRCSQNASFVTPTLCSRRSRTANTPFGQ